MTNRQAQIAHRIRETCLKILPDGAALKQNVLNLIEDLDMFLECVAGESRDARSPRNPP